MTYRVPASVKLRHIHSVSPPCCSCFHSVLMHRLDSTYHTANVIFRPLERPTVRILRRHDISISREHCFSTGNRRCYLWTFGKSFSIPLRDITQSPSPVRTTHNPALSRLPENATSYLSRPRYPRDIGSRERSGVLMYNRDVW